MIFLTSSPLRFPLDCYSVRSKKKCSPRILSPQLSLFNTPSVSRLKMETEKAQRIGNDPVLLQIAKLFMSTQCHPAPTRAFAARRNFPRKMWILFSKLSQAILHGTLFRGVYRHAGHFTNFPSECKQVNRNIIDKTLSNTRSHVIKTDCRQPPTFTMIRRRVT